MSSKTEIRRILKSVPIGANLMKTNQTISYATGDDGDLQAGRDDSFLVLPSNNPFGNTNRFTDELGGQTYTNSIAIDWSTFDSVNGKVLGYHLSPSFVAGDWSASNTAAQSQTVGSFTTGWRLPNANEQGNILSNYGIASSGHLNYPPFNYTGTNWNLFTSTTSPLSTSDCIIYTITNSARQPFLKTNAGPRYMICRDFTVTGTTLT